MPCVAGVYGAVPSFTTLVKTSVISLVSLVILFIIITICLGCCALSWQAILSPNVSRTPFIQDILRSMNAVVGLGVATAVLVSVGIGLQVGFLWKGNQDLLVYSKISHQIFTGLKPLLLCCLSRKFSHAMFPVLCKVISYGSGDNVVPMGGDGVFYINANGLSRTPRSALQIEGRVTLVLGPRPTFENVQTRRSKLFSRFSKTYIQTNKDRTFFR